PRPARRTRRGADGPDPLARGPPRACPVRAPSGAPDQGRHRTATGGPVAAIALGASGAGSPAVAVRAREPSGARSAVRNQGDPTPLVALIDGDASFCRGLFGRAPPMSENQDPSQPGANRRGIGRADPDHGDGLTTAPAREEGP